MGRNSLNNCSYFPLDTDMGDHRKVKILRNKFGQVLGFAFWAMMLSHLTGEDGNEMEYSDMEFEMFAAKLGCSNTEVKDMVDFCVKIELLFCKDSFLWSESLNERLAPVYEKRNKAREISATRKRRNDGTFGITVTEIPQAVGEVVTVPPQSRIDKSKGERKGVKKKTLQAEPATLYTNMISGYDTWFKERNKIAPKIDGAQGKAMKSIIQYLTTLAKKKNEGQEKIDAAVMSYFDWVLKNWDKLDKYMQEKTRLVDINSNLQNIIQKIKNHSKPSDMVRVRSLDEPNPHMITREKFESTANKEYYTKVQ